VSANPFAVEHPLDEAAIESFRRDGYVVLRDVFPREAIAPLLGPIRAAWAANKLNDLPMEQRDTYGRAFTQALNLGLRDARIFSFAYGKLFAGIAARLMGVPSVRMFLDEAFFKEPGSGPTPWHQDQAVWPFDARRGLTIWVPLMDVAEEMGTLTFAAGSHTDRELTGADISDESDRALARLVEERGFPLHEVGAIRLGDVTAHDGFLIHRAGQNRTRAIREAYAMHYFSDGARVLAPDNPSRRRILEHFAPGLRPGDLAASERWRLVYPEAEPLARTL